MNTMELLAPAGGMAELKAAVQSGADAVYIGAAEFSARSGADNFSRDAMREAVEYAHGYGVKVHCAINTLIKESELDNAIQTAIDANNCGVDALIIQDLGFAAHIRKVLPDIELHASTQMTVTSEEGVRQLEKMGFCRVVLSRELSLGEIRHIAKNVSAEIEVFVHGAICMSYSGQCLMSSILGGRSGNRGKCAQPCRLPYELTENGRVCDKGHILSPKDMALIDHLEALRKAGVRSLKIEGRLKSAEYVSAVTGIYRKYLDIPHRTESADMAELTNAFSRSGFTDGYLTGKLGRAMMSHDNPANNSGSKFTTQARERAQGKFIRKIPIDIYASLAKDDVLRLTAYTADGVCVSVEGDIKAECAKNTPLTHERVTEQLRRLGDTPFEAASVTVEIGEGITVPIKEINRVRRLLCDTVWQELGQRTSQGVNDISLGFAKSIDKHELYLSAEVMTEAQGRALIKSGGVRRIYASPEVIAGLKQLDTDTELVTRTADIFTDEEITTEAVSVASVGAMAHYGDKAKYGEWRLNVYNSLTVDTLSQLQCVTISPELNLADIRRVTEHTSGTQIELIGYGRLPLMIMKNCPIKAMGRCQNGKSIYTLRDRKNMEFPIICQKGCRALLLNSKPIYTADIIDEIRVAGIDCIRLNFTLETPDECIRILGEYKNAIDGSVANLMPQNTFTRGHLKRGI